MEWEPFDRSYSSTCKTHLMCHCIQPFPRHIWVEAGRTSPSKNDHHLWTRWQRQCQCATALRELRWILQSDKLDLNKICESLWISYKQTPLLFKWWLCRMTDSYATRSAEWQVNQSISPNSTGIRSLGFCPAVCRMVQYLDEKKKSSCEGSAGMDLVICRVGHR